MSDFNNPDNFDKYGNPIPSNARPFVYEPIQANGRAPYVLLGLLVLVGIVGGAMYFNGGTHKAANIANAPTPLGDTRPAPTPTPLPGTPADVPTRR